MDGTVYLADVVVLHSIIHHVVILRIDLNPSHQLWNRYLHLILSHHMARNCMSEITVIHSEALHVFTVLLYAHL